MKKIFLTLAVVLLAACSTPGQNQFDASDAGRSVITEFGTVVDVKPAKIQNRNTGLGAGAGMAAGAGLGTQVGQGNGELAATLVGMVAGAIVGGIVEQAVQNREAFAYTITLENGKTLTIAQYYKKDDPPIKTGDRVMVQTSGTYQRVLPASHLPTQIKRPKGIKVTD